MTPEQKIKHLILLKHQGWNAATMQLPQVTAENVDELFEEWQGEDGWDLQDAINEVRCSGIETSITAPHSRHYESESVAAQYIDGSWIGWTFWYGGGKHGEPESIDWMEDAYDLTCTEEQKVVTVRTFTAPEGIA